MTQSAFVDRVMVALGVLTDDSDVRTQYEVRANAVLSYINNGGGQVTLDNIGDYEILAVALGVSDMLNQSDSKYSAGFEAMAQQIQLAADSDGS